MTHIMNISKQAVLWFIVAVLVSTSVLFAVFVPREASAAVLIDGCYFNSRAEYQAYKYKSATKESKCPGFSGITKIDTSGYSSISTSTPMVKYTPGSSR